MAIASLWLPLGKLFGITITQQEAIAASITLFYIGLFILPYFKGEKFRSIHNMAPGVRTIDNIVQVDNASLVFSMLVFVGGMSLLAVQFWFMFGFIKDDNLQDIIMGATVLISLFAIILGGSLLERLIGALSYSILMFFTSTIMIDLLDISMAHNIVLSVRSFFIMIFFAPPLMLSIMAILFAPSRTVIVRTTTLVAFIILINVFGRAPKYMEELRTEVAKFEAQSHDHKP
jgi:hypothetical protein